MVGTRSAKPLPDRTVGHVLRAAREERGITLKAAAAALRIPVRQLMALEDCALQAFAAEVYARGVFLKYADYLGVKTDEAEQAFMRALGASRERVPLKLLRPRSWLERVLTPYWLFGMAGASAAVVVGAYVMWQVQSFWRLPALKLSEPQELVTSERTIMVRGSSEEQAAVTVNGQPVLLQPDGSFAAPLLLRPGINVLRVEATNAARRTRVAQKHLLVPRSSR